MKTETKENMFPTVETNDDAGDDTMAVPAPAAAQKATKQMIFFSIYIALAGWIFNFDLGNDGLIFCVNKRDIRG